MKFPKVSATNMLVMVAGLHRCSVNAGSTQHHFSKSSSFFINLCFRKKPRLYSAIDVTSLWATCRTVLVENVIVARLVKKNHVFFGKQNLQDFASRIALLSATSSYGVQLTLAHSIYLQSSVLASYLPLVAVECTLTKIPYD
jgi:hypothetical protein